jgi:uncharacterized membrane protein
MDERSGVSSIARVRALIVAAITALTGVAIFAGVTASVAPLIVVFVLVCPGLALVGALRLRDPLFEIVLGVGLSVSIAGLLATGQAPAYAQQTTRVFGVHAVRSGRLKWRNSRGTNALAASCCLLSTAMPTA